MQDPRDRTRIVNLFMEIYRLQLGVAKSEPSEIVPLNPDAEGPEFTYELRVQHHGRWSSRRITLGHIGEGSGSKSKCFKVVFDDMLVVKIPPRTVSAVEDYLSVIRREKRIADQLSPEIPCAASGISALMKRIPAMNFDQCLSSEEFEKRCTEWLDRSPKLTRYLMIGHTFVFFMDLLNHPFLGQYIRELHDLEAEIAEEIRHYNRILLDLEAFEGRYGDAHIHSFVGMGEAYGGYDTQIRQLIERHGLLGSVTPFMLRAWFFDRLAGDKTISERGRLPRAFADDLEKLLQDTRLRFREQLERYRRTVRHFLLRQTVSQSLLPMEGIIVHLLDLLACIEKKGVAIRDLKPDNIFVAGDLTMDLLANPSTEHPERRETPGAWAAPLKGRRPALGLIDFETAVRFRPERGQPLDQPMPGGTLSYATPSHFFKNETLAAVHRDLPLLFHLQDWHACIAIIYSVITGDMLFKGSKSLLTPLLQTAKRAQRTDHDLGAAYVEGNLAFWERANREVMEKTERYAALLSMVSVRLPDNARQLMLRLARQQLQTTPAKMDHYLSALSALADACTRQKLVSASRNAIRKYRRTLENNATREVDRRSSPLERHLAWLEQWKGAENQIRQTLARLECPGAVLPVSELLLFMFGTVVCGMLPAPQGLVGHAVESPHVA